MNFTPICQNIRSLDHRLLWAPDYVPLSRQCPQNYYHLCSVPFQRKHFGIILFKLDFIHHKTQGQFKVAVNNSFRLGICSFFCLRICSPSRRWSRVWRVFCSLKWNKWVDPAFAKPSNIFEKYVRMKLSLQKHCSSITTIWGPVTAALHWRESKWINTYWT